MIIKKNIFLRIAYTAEKIIKIFNYSKLAIIIYAIIVSAIIILIYRNLLIAQYVIK